MHLVWARLDALRASRQVTGWNNDVELHDLDGKDTWANHEWYLQGKLPRQRVVLVLEWLYRNGLVAYVGNGQGFARTYELTTIGRIIAQGWPPGSFASLPLVPLAGCWEALETVGTLGAEHADPGVYRERVAHLVRPANLTPKQVRAIAGASRARPLRPEAKGRMR